MDTVVDELITRETPPLSQNWLYIEEAVVLYHKYGSTLYRMGNALHKAGWVKIEIEQSARNRLTRIKEAEDRLSKFTPAAKTKKKSMFAGSGSIPGKNLVKGMPNVGLSKVTNIGSNIGSNIASGATGGTEGPRSRLGKVKIPGMGSESPSKSKSKPKR